MTGRTIVYEGAGVDFSASAAAIDHFAAAYYAVDPTRIALVERRLEELTTLPCYPLLDGVWILPAGEGDDANECGRINLIDHWEYPLDINGDVAFDEGEGFTGDALTGFMRSRKRIGTGNFQRNSCYLGVYVRPPIGTGGSGWVDVSCGPDCLIVARSGSTSRVRMFDGTTRNVFQGGSLSGAFAAVRRAAESYEFRPPLGSTAPGAVNGWETVTAASIASYGALAVLGSIASSARSGNQIAAASIGGGLSQEDVAYYQEWERGILTDIGAIT